MAESLLVEGIEDGYPVRWLLPDQVAREGEDAALGTLVLPNTLGLVTGGPNPDGGKKLIDYLLRPEVETRLSAGRSIQIPLNPAAEVGERAPKRAEIKTMSVSFAEIAQHMEDCSTWFREEFVR